ncbi:MAG: pantoate--beta-alanine ligase [Planctomycetota bacterium]|nr:pantoate--beta-alanine ligase [Planctomycetota bacterium]
MPERRPSQAPGDPATDAPIPAHATPGPVAILRTKVELDLWARSCPSSVFVPTMGALHEGHASLVRQASALAWSRGWLAGDRAACIVSIFVNPTQFNEAKDFDRYPRTLEADVALCAAAGASAVFAPSPDVVYPPGEPVPVPPLPRVATEPSLEDAHRPGHFAGVCQVVLRLFQLVRCRSAIFGEKDWQQLQVVRAMVADLDLDIEIVPGVTIREADGLAMSSRNRLLSPADRALAARLSAALRAASESTRTGSNAHPGRPLEARRAAEEAMHDALTRDAGFSEGAIEYAVIRDAQTLLEYSPARPARALIAARTPGGIRLIDNAPWPSDLPLGNHQTSRESNRSAS